MIKSVAEKIKNDWSQTTICRFWKMWSDDLEIFNSAHISSYRHLRFIGILTGWLLSTASVISSTGTGKFWTGAHHAPDEK